MADTVNSDGKESACNVGDFGLIPELRRSPGAGNSNPLQYSWLENSMDSGAWWATVHGVTESDMTELLTPECNILCFEVLFLVNYFLSVVALLYFFLVFDVLFLYWSIWSKELVVQSLSHVQIFATPWTAAFQASLSLTVSWSLLQLMSMESVMPFNHLIFSHPHHLLPSIFPSIRVFPKELGKTGFTSHGKVLELQLRH